jgi:hypothetical protein
MAAADALLRRLNARRERHDGREDQVARNCRMQGQ